MSVVSLLSAMCHYSRSRQRNSNSGPRLRSLRGVLLLEALEGRLCPGVLTLTPSSVRAGYGISIFATDFSGVTSILFRDQGGELVTDMAGNVRLFPSDSDGQSAAYVTPTQNFGSGDALALARAGSNIYMTQLTSAKLVQINDTGNFVAEILPSLPVASGMVANPKNGHLFVDDQTNMIYDVDPKARTYKGFIDSGDDYGLAITADGATLYGADSVNNNVMGYDTTTGRSVFNSGNIPGGPNGLALGTGRFAGHLYVVTLDGSLLDIDLASRTQTVIANGGQRGDFLAFDPNDGSLLVTQTDRIVRVKFPTGQAASFRVDAATNVLPGQPFVATVTALDVDGHVATGYTGTVKFTSSDPYPGLVPPNYTFTPSDNGTHNFAAVLFTAGTQTLTAQDTASSSITGSATVVVHAAAATHLKITAPTTTVAGASFDVTIAALDFYGNADPNYTDTVAFTSTDSASGVVLPANYTFTAADNGTHTFSGGVTLLSAGPGTITVTDKANPSFTTSANLQVMPAPATRLVLSAPSTAVAGAPFDVTITAFDPYGNVDSNYTGTVTFRSTDTHPGVLPSDYTFSSADKGTHTFTGVTFFTAAAQSLTAQDTANSSLTASDPVTVTPAPVSVFVIAAPASVVSGRPFPITVTAFDLYGNLEINYTGTVTFASSDPNPALLPADYTFTPGDMGKFNFAAVFFTPGNQILTVTDKETGVAGNATITVTSPAAPPPGGGHGSKGDIFATLSPSPEIASLDWLFATLNDRNRSQ
jgi:sugar lactone lactonase YvrE